MLALMKVFCGVLVLGRITTANLSAFKAEPQMYPGISSLNAVFAHMRFGFCEFDPVEM
jgi:precorrin-6B methylase 1